MDDLDLFMARPVHMCHVPHRHVPPTPEGVAAVNALKIVSCCSSPSPCKGGGDEYHFSTTQPGTCRRGVAVISEKKCVVNLMIRYICCDGADSAPLPVVLELGMNIFVYCTDNFDGGELSVTPLPESTQKLYPSVLMIEWGCLMNYSFDYHSAPPWALVITDGTCAAPIPQLSSLARLTVGELKLGQIHEDDVPSCVRKTTFSIVVNKYACSCHGELL